MMVEGAEQQSSHFTSEQLKQLETVMMHIESGLVSGSIHPTIIKDSTEEIIINASTKNGITPLHLAAENDCTEVIDAFIQHLASGDRSDALEAGPTESVAAKSTLEVNVRDSVGETALHKAGRNKHFISYRKLVSIGASESILNMLKQTPKQLLIDDILL
jgi:ankyrin repeat protein